MKNIKTYEDFINEEINLKKGLMGAALATSLMGGVQSCDTKPTESEIYYTRQNDEYEREREDYLLDMEIENNLLSEYKQNTRSFNIPIILKNIPEDINISSDKYITIYYRNNNDITDVSKFEKIKNIIFEGDPIVNLDISKYKYELDKVRKELILEDLVTIELNLEHPFGDPSLNLKDKYSSLFNSLSDYDYNLCSEDGQINIQVLLKVTFSKK